MNDFIDVMVLGVGHSIILPHLGRADNSELTSEKFSDEPLTNYGLYSSKRVREMGLSDSVEEGFIEPTYRMLSEVIVAKGYNPTDFSKKGVLKNSLHLLVGQTVYTDHYTSTQNQVGVVKDVYWQESFKQGGVTIPAGINGIFKIDSKSNEKLSRGIQMDPPSIHSNSVSVTFEWEPSHHFEDLWEFYDKLGTYDKDGELIRRIVTNIISYSETSLVSQGADPFAKKIMADGKLTNIAYAKAAYYGKTDNMDNQEVLDNLVKRNIYFGDFKSLDTLENGLLNIADIHNTGKYNSKGEDQTNNNKPIKTDEMENGEKTKSEDQKTENLDQLFGEGLLNLAEGKDATMELAKEAIQSLIEKNKELSKKVKGLELKEEIADKYISDVRTETLSSYKKVVGGEDNVDEHLVKLIAETNLDTLLSLRKSYQTQVEEKFKMKCSKCGSHDVSRSSSLSEEEETSTSEQSLEDNNSIEDTVRNLTRSKLQNQKNK